MTPDFENGAMEESKDFEETGFLGFPVSCRQGEAAVVNDRNPTTAGGYESKPNGLYTNNSFSNRNRSGLA